MQLLFTLEELKLVTRALEKCLAHARDDKSARKRVIAAALLDKVISHDLRFSAEELDDLADMLAGCKRELKSRIATESDAQVKTHLQEQQRTLEHAMDKVTEACAML